MCVRRLPSLPLIATCILLTGGCGWAQQEESDAGLSDLHNSVLHRLFTGGRDACLEDTRYPVSLDGLKAGQAKFLVLSIAVPRFSMRTQETASLNEITDFLDKFRRSAPSQGLAFAGSQRELERARHANRPAFTFALEGSHLLEGEPDCIDRLHAAGVRVIGIAHWFQNEFLLDPSGLPSATKAPHPLTDACVLSQKGRTLLAQMVEKKIRIDVSHLGRAAFREIVEWNAGRTPLIASHSNARALHNVSRNLDDEQIRAVAESGGLIGVCLHKRLLVADGKMASVEDVVDHIDYLRKIAGPEHVAIGSDLEGRITPPQGLRRLEDLVAVREEMGRRGYSAKDKAAILWKNALRVLPD